MYNLDSERHKALIVLVFRISAYFCVEICAEWVHSAQIEHENGAKLWKIEGLNAYDARYPNQRGKGLWNQLEFIKLKI